MFGSNVEFKYTAAVLGTIFASVGSATVYLDMTSQIIQGLDTFKNRIGDVITTKHLMLTGSLVGAQVGGVTDDVRNIVRICLFWGNPGLAPSFTVSSLFGPDFFPGIDKVEYDKCIVLTSPGKDTVGYIPSQKLISFNVNIPNSVRYYGNGLGTVTSRSLYLAMVSDSGVIPHPGFVSGQAVLTYLDH
jgi:hypothetical protein